MNGAILGELRFFVTSIIWGVLLLIIYDCLRIERRLISHNGFFIGLEDMIYWVVSSVLIFHMMYKQNDGIIRGFSIIGMLLGMLVYHNSISSYFVDIISKVLIKIKKTIFIVINTILKPFLYLTGKLRKALGYFVGIVKKVVHNLQKRLKKIRKTSKITVNDNKNSKEGKDKAKKQTTSSKKKNKKLSKKEKNNFNKKGIKDTGKIEVNKR